MSSNVSVTDRDDPTRNVNLNVAKPSKKTDKQSWNYVLRSGLAGGVAGCVAKTTVAPLDRVKILFQASNPDFQHYAGSWNGVFRAAKEIYGDGGVRGLLQGHSATLLRIFPYAAVKFMAYDQVRFLLMPTRESETNLRRFSAGAISGMISVFCTYPLELIRVRMAFQTRNSSPPHLSYSPSSSLPHSSPPPPARPSILRAMKQLYNEGVPALPPSSSSSAASLLPTTRSIFTRFPILKFYRGFTVTITGMIPYAGTSFLAWDFLRYHLLPPSPRIGQASHKERGAPVADLSIGAVSGAIAQTVSYPFEIVRRRMQVGGLTSPDRWLRWGETINAIWNSPWGHGKNAMAVGGWRNFYVGLSIGYLKVVPMTAVSFTVWQAGKRVLGV
ncbi:hypothetical protein JAAARDRAFT_125657 [Jaapia argillacea MUCL 33604]|uniref:Mitochondrial carrier n=1 Tax=Jaapia argillacea MUCL 33604 TaxID=933084 RepID=A0A067Q2X8_9AGAM|nr:hypothetical protein JAAARDRAFT_125657 [Jaapia argillacea MUCL 33604]